MAGAGLDADIVHHLNPRWKAALGKVAYWIGGFAQLGRTLPEFTVESGGTSARVSLALLSRVRNYGGDIEITRHACLLDDTFALALFEGRSTFRYLKYFLAILARRLERVSGVRLLAASRAELTACGDERVFVQVDGEAAGWLPATVEIVPSALTLLTPPSCRARLNAVAAVPSYSWTHSRTR